MKSVFKYTIAALFAAAIAFSCQKGIEEPIQKDGTTHTFTCKFATPDPESKVAVSNAGKSTWEVGDEISIHGGTDGRDRAVVTLTAADISSDGKTATITFSGLDPYDRTADNIKSGYYAQYPASAVPSGNLYYECRFNKTNEILMAACDVGDTFVFFNLCGIISYTTTADVDQVIFSGNNEEAVGYDVYQARVRDDGSGAYCNYWKPGNGSGTPVPQTSITADVVADGSTLNYLCFPNGANFTTGFTFKFLKEGNIVKTLSTKTAMNVAVGKLLPLGDVTANMNDYEVSDHKSAITGATDLSADQANCFVITAPGSYKFPAVKGNSSEEAGNVYGATILWETYNNAEDVTANSVIEAVDYEDNWVYFKTPSTLKAGNALIAATNKDNEIIWSWHIWIPSTAITTGTYGNIYNHELMDRNLGALVAATTSSVTVESYGLNYQWGRKDPFVGSKSLTSSTQASVAGQAMTVAGDHMTVDETIAAPTVFAVYSATDTWGPWLNPADDTATLWKDGEKTKYDPCPAGYRVPARNDSQPLHSSDLSTVTGWSEDADAHYFTLGDPAAVFPYCGYLAENGALDYVGSRSFIWMSRVSSDNSAYFMNVRAGSSHGRTSTVTSRGGTVRCVKEEEVPPTIVAATGVVLDGDMSEWDAAEAITCSGSIKEWKFGSDADNVYFYFKISKSDIKDDGGSYNWKRYIYMAFDTDNKASTGITYSGAGLDFPGCDAAAALYPFRGTVPDGQSYPAGVEIVNGADEQGWTKSPANGDNTGYKVTAFGYVSGDYGYLEVGVPRAGIGSPSSGYMKVQFSFSWNLTDAQIISIN